MTLRERRPKRQETCTTIVYDTREECKSELFYKDRKHRREGVRTKSEKEFLRTKENHSSL